MKNTKKDNRGGKRINAGRKTIDTKECKVRLTSAEITALKYLYGSVGKALLFVIYPHGKRP